MSDISKQNPNVASSQPKGRMLFNDWIELCGISGELEGLSMGFDMTKGDVNWQGVVEALKDLSQKVERIRLRHDPIYPQDQFRFVPGYSELPERRKLEPTKVKPLIKR